MPAEPAPTLYDALQLPRSASPEDVRTAYRRLAREHHPDRAGADGEAMARINQAYEVLCDPERRARYDHQLDTRPAPRKPGRVVLPGDRRRTRLIWAATAVAAVVIVGLTAMAGLRARESVEPASAGVAPLSLPLPQDDAQTAIRPVTEEGLRLIPSRSMASVPRAGENTAGTPAARTP